jgi:hypothetical protein
MSDDYVDGLDKEFDSKAFIANNGYTNTPQSSQFVVKPAVPDDDVVEIEPVAPLVKPAPLIIKLPITPPRPSTGSLSVNVSPPVPRTLPPNISLKCPVTNKTIIEKKECEESGDEYVSESSSSESSDDDDAIPIRTPPSPKAPKYHYTSTKITACNYPPATPQSVIAPSKKRARSDDDDEEVEWEPKALTPPKKLKAVKAKSDPSNVKQRDASKCK